MLVFRKFCVRTKCMVSYIFNVMGVVSTFIQFYVISLLYQIIFSNKNALWDLNCSKHRVWMVEGYCECFMKIDPVLLVFVVVIYSFSHWPFNFSLPKKYWLQISWKTGYLSCWKELEHYSKQGTFSRFL